MNSYVDGKDSQKKGINIIIEKEKSNMKKNNPFTMARKKMDGINSEKIRNMNVYRLKYILQGVSSKK